MSGFDSRTAKAVWTIFLLALGLVVIYYIRTVLLVFVLAILLAYLLAPVVDLVSGWFRLRARRVWALAIVYTAFVGVLVLAGALVGDRVAQEASNLAQGFPKLEQTLEQRLSEPGPAWIQPVKNYLLTQIREHGQSFSGVLVPVVQKAVSHAFSLLSSILFVVLIPILSFFFLKDGKEMLESALGLLSEERREVWLDISADVHNLLGQFIRALVILSIATFVFYAAFFAVARMPYAVLLATIAGALEFIPVFGPLSAAVIIVTVAIFAGYPHILAILIFLGAYRVFQDYILSPHLMSSGVALHPIVVIFGALAGEALAGVPGMFLSVPVLATLRVVFVRIRKSSRKALLEHTNRPAGGV
ncbi:MAG TPA: AI-2E family transporter [Bryobacteraceae bacterium]|nr:AI-2E family transporter [Bryobacteraceae bacterium]HPU71886.1 AI-2E family transporter [Bryobacteraceae bacterium]